MTPETDVSAEFQRARVALATAVAGFRERLVLVSDEEWDAPTPCSEWAVRDLVAHLVGGGRMSELLLDGASAEEAFNALFSLALQGDLLAEFDTACRRQADAFARDGAAEATCHHPLRDMPGSQFIWLRVRDTLVHTWDLARSIGADENLEEGLVDMVWEQVAPLSAMMATSGMFGEGASPTLPADASTQHRLLDALGRRP
jgi:uncharacterized protein (TIGR03086 family)